MDMMELKEIVTKRLEQLNLGAVEAATAGGLERTFIRDIIEGKKKSVRSDKLPGLAQALKLDHLALAEGRLKPIEIASELPVIRGEKEIEQVLKQIEGLDEYNRGVALSIIMNAIKAGVYEQEHSRSDDQSEIANHHHEQTP